MMSGNFPCFCYDQFVQIACDRWNKIIGESSMDILFDNIFNIPDGIIVFFIY